MAASAAVALALGPSPGLEPAENWDDDFEFGGGGRGESVGTGGGGGSGRRRNSKSAGVGRGSGGYASSGMGPGTESVGHTAGVSGPSDISASEEDHLSSSTPSAHCQGHTHPEPLHIRAAAFSPSSPVSGSSAYVTPTNLSPLGSATSGASIDPQPSVPATKKPTFAPGPSNGRPLQQSASLGRTGAAGVLSSSEAVGEGDSDAHEAGGAGEGALMKEKEKYARRNSLGDLQIPTRISQAQVGLRRDLDMVKEFAGYVGEIKEFQQTYHALASEIQAMLDAQAHDLQHQHQHQSPLVSNPPPPPAKDSIHTTSGFFSAFRDIRKPKNRGRSNTNGRLSLPPQHEQPKEKEMEEQPSKSKEHLLAYKELASAFWSITSKYRITWECAELLVELGGGGPDESRSSLNTSASAPVAVATSVDSMGRERASTDTLSAGDQSKPLPALPHPSSSSSSSPPTPAHSRQHLPTQPPHAPPPSALVSAPTNSTGWHDHDLSQRQRQVVLLREMLSNSSTSTSVAAEETQTVTTTAMEVDREWRWGGDGLGNSTVTLPLPEEEEERTARGREKGTGSSRLELGMRGIRDMLRALKFKSSRAHAEDAAPSSYYTAPQPKLQPSPRRPSLASIFRLGTKTKNRASASTVTLVEDLPVPISSVPSSASPSSSMPPCCDHPTGAEDSSSNSTGEEEDWDHMDSAFDFDSSDAFATVRGRRRTGTTTGWEGGHRSPDQQPNAFNHINTSTPARTHTNANAATKTGTVRSMPPYPTPSDSTSLQPDPIQKLAMTPENIRPLLENAREVRAKIVECLAELRGLVPPDGHDGS
ncbi:unnamed protein product [Cyclocybe aegerita]|uniref:Uncharacterized protein n=1 Tax=Cyclocybe aegerita TaxID=1973307 RepID=A0A8S0WYJ8_CYCAE|nr:unnamed protein product [Cyclocybe aegerita]